MSRSKRKTPIFKWTVSESDKISKQLCNRRFRKMAKRNLKRGIFLPIKQAEAWDEWAFASDGKHYIADASKKIMRK